MTMQEKKHHHELKLELQSVQYYAISNEVEGEYPEGDAAYDLNQIAEDAANMSKIGMSVKNRKRWEAVKMCHERNKATAQKLEDRKIRMDTQSPEIRGSNVSKGHKYS